MKLEWEKLGTAAAAAKMALVTTHVRPDGDALGSELALAELLESRGVQVEIYNASPTPNRYRFLDPAGTRIGFQTEGVGEPKSTPDLLVVVDTGAWSQLAGLAPYVRGLDAPKVVIDHHVTQDDLGAVRLVDASAPACGLMILRAFEHFGLQPSPVAAQALFTAIAMDTGWMRHSNTTAEVLAALSKLAEFGANPCEIHRHLFESDSPARLRLMGIMLSRLTVECEGRLAYSHITQDDIRSVQAHPMDTEDFIGVPMSIAGVDSALLFIEQRGGGVKVSFRSRRLLDCSAIASRFGGGGHRPAAGATLASNLPLAMERVLAAVRPILQEEK